MNSMRLIRCGLAACFLAGLIGHAALAQAPLDPVASPTEGGQETLQSLEALQRALAMKEAEAAALQAQLAAAGDDLQRDDLLHK